MSVQRRIAAPAAEVWRVAADPAHLARWWPRTVRVEALSGEGRRARWTQVLETKGGNTVRADYRCVESTDRSRALWRQSVEGTPFERVLRRSEIELRVEPAGDAARLSLTSRQTLRGVSRLGGLLMRRAAKRTLSLAAAGLAETLEATETPAESR